MINSTITFTHSGVSGRTEVNGSHAFVTYAGAGFELALLRDPLK